MKDWIYSFHGQREFQFVCYIVVSLDNLERAEVLVVKGLVRSLCFDVSLVQYDHVSYLEFRC